MMLICLGGRDDSGEWSGFHRDHPAFIGVLLCLCTIGIPAAGMHKHGRYCHSPEPTSESCGNPYFPIAARGGFMRMTLWLYMYGSCLGIQLWPRYFSNDLACLKKCHDTQKQKAIDRAVAAAGRFDAASNPSSSVGDSEGMHENLAA